MKNPPEGMRDPTWWDKVKDGWDNFNVLSPTVVLRNGFVNVEPMILRNFTRDSSTQYGQNYGQGITNVTYHVEVGDVNVAQTNASPQEIGQSVADRTTNALNDRANYSQINSAVTGMQII